MKKSILIIALISFCYSLRAQTILQQMKHNFDSGMNVLKKSFRSQKSKSNQTNTVQPAPNNSINPAHQQTNQGKETSKIDESNEPKIYHSVPKPTSVNNGGITSIVSQFNNKLYVEYKMDVPNQSSETTQLAELDGSELKLITHPDASFANQSGYSGSPAVYNNNLYFRSTNSKGISQLAEYDGQNIKLIPNPDNGLGFIGNPVVYNGKLYFSYVPEQNSPGITSFLGLNSALNDKNGNSYLIYQQQILPFVKLAMYDGTKISIISGSYIPDDNFPLVYNDKLFVKCYYSPAQETKSDDVVAAPVSQPVMQSIGLVGGNAILPVPVKTSVDPYGGSAAVLSNDIYLGGTSLPIGGAPLVSIYNGKTISTYSSNEPIYKFLTKYSGKVYGVMSNGSNKTDFFEFNGSATTILQDLKMNDTTLKYENFLIAYNNKLYLSYEGNSTSYVVEYDGKNFNILALPNGFNEHYDREASPDNAFIFEGQLFFHYNSGKVVVYNKSRLITIKSLTGLEGDEKPLMFNNKLFFANDNLNYLEADDTSKINEEISANSNSTSNTNVVVSQPVSETQPAETSGSVPTFPGGPAAWNKFLETSLANFPQSNGAPAGRYEVKVSVTVDEEGNLSEFQFLNDPGYGAAMSTNIALHKSPRWIPAKQNGKPIETKNFIIPFVFLVTEQ